jgi:glucose-6-phosphate isomerase
VTNLTGSGEWLDLLQHYQEIKDVKMMDLFTQDVNRAQRFQLESCGLLFDYSKNRITEATIDKLLRLARAAELEKMIKEMYHGEKINTTEERAVLHIALRNRSNSPIYVNGNDVMPAVNSELKKMQRIVNKVRSGQWLGYSGKSIKYVVNIGIGGSDLGPCMVTKALSAIADKSSPQVFFLSNVDGSLLTEISQKIKIEQTLFIVASKTFTTQETMTNAWTMRDILIRKYKGNQQAVRSHFVAISTDLDKVRDFGIDVKNTLGFWNWVGGRYSLWSSIGLSIALRLGFENFTQLLQGAHDMDQHFYHAELDSNLPVIMALLGVWYNNFFKAQSHAILPYDESLSFFPAYLQQLDMESNGKSITKEGAQVDFQTGPIIWGQPGTNGQHAFYQLLHQGTKMVPCDFIAPVNSLNEINDHHPILISNFMAQTEALMKGKSADEVRSELVQEKKTENEILSLLPHKIFTGNRPTNTIMFNKMTPKILGSLIALYEHKIFTQGVIWGINSFDQMGVELGKQLAKKILSELKDESAFTHSYHDESTKSLMHYYLKNRQA